MEKVQSLEKSRACTGRCDCRVMAVHWFPGWARYMLGRSLAPSYVPSPAAAGLAMLKLAELRAGETLVDLGCGDGRLLKLAVTDFNASSAIGYEMDPGLAKTARSICGFDSRITIHERDAFEAEPSLATADVVALYLTESGNTKLLPMLRRALTKPGARVVSYVWGLGKDVPPTSTARLSGEGVVLAIGQPNILRWDRTDLHCPRTVAA